jgi:hypothetical protein
MGDFAAIFVILLRVLIPFTILRWPLAGTALAILADTADVMIFEAFWYGFLEGVPYHVIDKIFDMWTLFFEFLVVRQWVDILARKTGMLLFGWRFVGFLVFIIFGLREAFFFAPNIFEYFFLTMLVIWKFDKKFELKKRSLAIILIAIAIPKVTLEYLLHFRDPHGPFVSWVWFRDNVFYWLYD